MFTVHCPRHGREVLLSERRVESVRSTTSGVELHWVCWCGHRGSMLTARLRRSSALVLIRRANQDSEAAARR